MTTATRTEEWVVYAAGAVQGIVLVTFPAASTIFTDPDRVRPVEHAVRAPLPPAGGDRDHRLAPRRVARRRFGTKRVYLAGLACGLVSMLLLIVSQFFESDTSVAFPLLLVATAFLGAASGSPSRR